MARKIPKLILHSRSVAAQRFTLSLVIGVAVVLSAAVLTSTGTLAQLERELLDFRFRHFAYFNPRPTDRVIHVDIDDPALATIGRWPWGRELLGQVVDELSRAGARVIAFDVLFTEPDDQRVVREIAPDGEPVYHEVNGDRELARAARRSANVMLPVDLGLLPRYDALKHNVRSLLLKDLTLDRETIALRLALNVAEQRQVQAFLTEMKATVLREKLWAIFVDAPPPPAPPPTFEQVRAVLLPGVADYVSDSLELGLLRDEYQRVTALAALSRGLPAIFAHGPRFGQGGAPAVPVPQLAAASQGTGFVTFRHESDGIVRTVPLWLTSGGKSYPHLSLAAACAYLNVPIGALQVTEEATIIPAATLPDGSVRDIRIPMLRQRHGDGWLADEGLVLIPWQNNAPGWEYLFDPNSVEGRQHLPISKLVEVARLRETAIFNEQQADAALVAVMFQQALGDVFSFADAREFKAFSDALESQAREALHDSLAAEIYANSHAQRLEARKDIVAAIEQIISTDPATLAEPVRELLPLLRDGLQRHREAVEHAGRARQTITEAEQSIRGLVRNTVCLVGWTATASIADFVPTSLHARCPGVIIYGAMLNGIFTGHFIERQTLWRDMLLVVAVGVLAVLIAAVFSPVITLVLTLLVLGGYMLINGLVLFDYYDVWAHAAGPLVAGAGSWAGITVYRLVAEQHDRARITRQFKSYIAPGLVDYLVENPHVVKLEGDSREMTCVFTDFQGFTSLSEQLGPQDTVKVLNHYLSIATDHLMEHHATVNKYLGDGILAFWNAPVDNPNHALDACRSVLAVHAAMPALRMEGELGELPTLTMRVGITTGMMSVGDFGAPPRRSDYTVIGDNVNLASRLENANKQFGTKVLISARTFELVQHEMLCRPIGRIVVVGRKEPETVYELLTTHAAATEAQRQLAAATADAVEAYVHGDFQHAIDLFTGIVTAHGPSKLPDRYIQTCREHMDQQPDQPFPGVLVLTEK